jgi:hypothetical protein
MGRLPQPNFDARALGEGRVRSGQAVMHAALGSLASARVPFSMRGLLR